MRRLRTWRKRGRRLMRSKVEKGQTGYRNKTRKKRRLLRMDETEGRMELEVGGGKHIYFSFEARSRYRISNDNDDLLYCIASLGGKRRSKVTPETNDP